MFAVPTTGVYRCVYGGEDLVFKKLPQIFQNLTMVASCLFFHDFVSPPLEFEIQAKLFLATLSPHTSCAKQQGAQETLHLLLFNDIESFPGTENSKHSEKSLKSLGLFFWGPEWQNHLDSLLSPPLRPSSSSCHRAQWQDIRASDNN